MYLDEILEHKRGQWTDGCAPSAAGVPETRRSPSRPGAFAAALRRDVVAVIAELKPRSPSKGDLWPSGLGVPLARDYAALGASAVSVLADDGFFGGSPALVADVAADDRVTVPVMYKDFVVDIRQVELAWRSGADALLVIARALEPGRLREVTRHATDLGLDVLVETFSAAEIEQALAADARIIGINNRDLDTFEVDLDNSERLRALLPDDVVTISESGIGGARDVRRVADAGFDAVLVGETLLGSPDLAGSLNELAGVRR